MNSLPSPLLSQIETLLATGDVPQAQRLAEAWAQQEPASGRAQEIRGIVALAQGRWREALQLLEEASLLVPLAVVGQCALADCYQRLGKSDLAATIYLYLAQRDDVPATALARIAAGLGAAGKLAAALEVCRKAADMLPEDDDPLFGMACYMTRLGYPPELVLSVLSRAQSLAPERLLHQIASAALLDQLGRRAEARALIASWTDEQVANVSCPRCLLRLSEICRRAGDEELAAVLDARMFRAVFTRRNHSNVPSPEEDRP